METVPRLAPPRRSPQKITISPEVSFLCLFFYFMLTMEQRLVNSLNKPPGRISPFKGKMSQLSSDQIFATTPRRIINFKTQSVDRYNKPEIKFKNLERLAPSKSLGTPSRMVIGKKPQSEQVSRLNRPTVSSSLKENDPNTNLLETFKSKSILKRTLSPPNEKEETDDNDLRTTINTIKNQGIPNDTLQLLTKKRKVTFNVEDDLLQKILNNQELILKRLDRIENHLQI